jgi:hypothetical protein
MRNVTSLLICAVMLASVPSNAFAQAPAQPEPVASGKGAIDAQTKPKSDLRTAIAEVVAKGRANAVTEADIKRFERERLNPQSTAKNDSGYGKKEKILVFSIVAGLIVLAVVLGIKTGKGGHAFCDTDPTDPDCLLPQ